MRGQALKVAGWPEGNSRLVKLLRAEWATMRNLDVLFSRVLYVANLRTVSPPSPVNSPTHCPGGVSSICFSQCGLDCVPGLGAERGKPAAAEGDFRSLREDR